MVVRSFTFRISGNDALADNTVKSFLSCWDTNDIASLPDSNLGFRALYASKKSEVQGTVPWAAAKKVVQSADPTSSAVAVSSVAMVITGLVAYDDNSSKSFAFEVRDDGSVYNHTGTEGSTAWANLVDAAAANSKMDEMFTALYTSVGQAITVTIS